MAPIVSLEQATRELMLNAVEHGNGNNPEKRVACTVKRLDPDKFLVTVHDEGSGFDFSKVDLVNVSPLDAERHRGLVIVNSIADTLEFRDNGATVIISITLPRITKFNVQKNGSSFIIRPDGDLVASSLEGFKQTVLMCINDKPDVLRFDFVNVITVDSMCLGVLALLTKKVEGQSRPKLEIINMTPDIKELFWLTRLSVVYSIQETNT
jgi:anti-anti-sigma regulatory factor